MARRVALYNGSTWDMGDIDPQTYLDEALVPHFADLRGATFQRRENPERDEIVFEFSKRAGQKGFDLTLAAA